MRSTSTVPPSSQLRAARVNSGSSSTWNWLTVRKMGSARVRSCRHFRFVEDFLQHFPRTSSPFSTASDHAEPVLKYGERRALHIIGQNVAAACHQRQRLRCSEQRHGSTGTDTKFDVRMMPGPVHDLNHVVHDFVVDVHLPALALKVEYVFGCEYGLQLLAVVS